MSDWMIFAERLSEQIKRQNLSIRQLAERMDMAPTTIFRYAKGQRVPRASEILKASDVLGVTCDYLVGLSDDPKKTSRSSAEPERDIPKKPKEIMDSTWGIHKKQAVCPKCDYYLGHVAFLGDYKGKRVTYCEHCGQAIDWEGWDSDE